MPCRYGYRRYEFSQLEKNEKLALLNGHQRQFERSRGENDALADLAEKVKEKWEAIQEYYMKNAKGLIVTGAIRIQRQI